MSDCLCQYTLTIACMTQEENKGFSGVVSCSSCCNILCAWYLVTVWASHLKYGDLFPFAEEAWRSSTICIVNVAAIILFSFLSQLLLLFLSILRLMVTIYPLSSSFKQLSFVQKIILFVLILSTTIAAVVTYVFVLEAHLSPTSLCTAFIDPTKQLLITQILVWLVALSQSATAAAVVVMSILLVDTVKMSEEKVQPKSKFQNSSKAMIMQLSLLSCSSIVCWLPSNLLKLLTAYLDKFPLRIVYWSSAVVVPLNPVLHPVIFTVVFVRKSLKMRQRKK